MFILLWMKTPILIFYSGGVDVRGRSLNEILNWGNDELEGVHDYIQWLFPLEEPSAYNPEAPILTPQDIATFRGSAELKSRLRMSLARMASFYGLSITDDYPVEFVRTPGFRTRAADWARPGNHNHLRLTRILKCLGILGMQSEARALLLELENIHSQYSEWISNATLGYWRRAIC